MNIAIQFIREHFYFTKIKITFKNIIKIVDFINYIRKFNNIFKTQRNFFMKRGHDRFDFDY